MLLPSSCLYCTNVLPIENKLLPYSSWLFLEALTKVPKGDVMFLKLILSSSVILDNEKVSPKGRLAVAVEDKASPRASNPYTQSKKNLDQQYRKL